MVDILCKNNATRLSIDFTPYAWCPNAGILESKDGFCLEIEIDQHGGSRMRDHRLSDRFPHQNATSRDFGFTCSVWKRLESLN